MDVAITGLGVISAIGAGFAASRAALRAGRGGLAMTGGLDHPLAAPRPLGRVPDGWMGGGSGHPPDRGRALLAAAVREALASAGVTPAALAPGRVCLGTTLAGMRSGTAGYRDWRDGRPVAPSLLADYLPGDQAARVVRAVGLRAAVQVVSDACASGASAIALAAAAVRAGRVPWALAGGYDPLCAFVVTGFDSLMALAPEACRPFDRRRNGLALGEGAACLFLEPAAGAAARGARVHARLLGEAVTGDAHHLTHPEPSGEGAARAMRQALAAAGVAPTDVAWVKAHGTGTVANDRMEAAAIASALGDAAPRVPVSSLKPLVGHTLGGAGAVEAVLALAAAAEGRIPPTAGLETPDPRCAGLDLVQGAARPYGGGPIVCNAFGFGGLNAVLVLAPGPAGRS